MNSPVRRIHDKRVTSPDFGHDGAVSGPKSQADHVVEETGRVLAVRSDGAAQVRTASGTYEVERAVSCLVAAEVDDLVLVARSPHEGAFVLAVLRRETSAATTVALAGDLDVRLGGGRFRVAAQEGVDLLSARDVNVVASGLRVNAGEGSLVLKTLSFLGEAVSAEIDRMKLLGGRFDAVLDRFSQRVQRSYRTVAETDHLRAQRIDHTAEKTMSLHAEHALVTADELVKVDGEQIHLG
ncbi:hypothetical protein A7982_12541 [Minicystis rosea]|nr:hypothetical protein A7982_12541 [Minicystis rosea]